MDKGTLDKAKRFVEGLTPEDKALIEDCDWRATINRCLPGLAIGNAGVYLIVQRLNPLASTPRRLFFHLGVSFVAWFGGKVSYIPLCVEAIAVHGAYDSPLAQRIRQKKGVPVAEEEDSS